MAAAAGKRLDPYSARYFALCGESGARRVEPALSPDALPADAVAWCEVGAGGWTHLECYRDHWGLKAGGRA